MGFVVVVLLLLFTSTTVGFSGRISRSEFLKNVAVGAPSVATAFSFPSLSGATTAGTVTITSATSSASATSWPLGKVAFSLLPLYGTSTPRPSLETTIVEDKIFTHDQLQGIVNVDVPVRQTVIVLSEASGGGLLIVNPLAPTPQLLAMVRNLENKYGKVRHIVLATSALEHKATFGPFAQNFRSATCWVNPGQWSFPVQLPLEWSGVLQRGSRLRELEGIGKSGRYNKYFKDSPEWLQDVEYETLGPLVFKSVGTFSETALFHKSTRTLIVTDTVIRVSDTPPPVINEFASAALLYHSRDKITDPVVDSVDQRSKGWRRMVQFGLTFFPSRIIVTDFGVAINEASRLPADVKRLSAGNVYGGLYPWSWEDGDKDLESFAAYKDTLFCPPILTKLILDREPEAVLDWVRRVTTKFQFVRIIPGHLDNNVKASPKDFAAAFDFLREGGEWENNNKHRNRTEKGGKKMMMRKKAQPLDDDLRLLQNASDFLTKFGVVDESKVPQTNRK